MIRHDRMSIGSWCGAFRCEYDTTGVAWAKERIYQGVQRSQNCLCACYSSYLATRGTDFLSCPFLNFNHDLPHASSTMSASS